MSSLAGPATPVRGLPVPGLPVLGLPVVGLTLLGLTVLGLTMFGLFASSPAWASGTGASPSSSSVSDPSAVVLSAAATPANLSADGGVTAVAGTVDHAVTCQLLLLSAQSFPVVYSHNPRACTSGIFSANVTVGPNNTTVPRTIAFALEARNGGSSSIGRFYVLLAAAKPPAVLSVSVTPSTLPATGGVVAIAARVGNAGTCQLQLLSAQSFPVVYSHNPRACTSGTFSANVTVGPNNTTVPRTVAFSLAAAEGSSHSDDPFVVTLAAAPVATKTAVPATTRQPSVAASSSPLAVTQSSNWSGYSTTGGPFTVVKGTFTVPSVQPGTPPFDQVAEWVGVDGASNTDTSLIQAGVDEFSDPTDPTNFDVQAWWEILPAAETNITTVAVKAGDSITVTLWQVSSTAWEIELNDNTNGESFTTPPEKYSGPGSTAEWIVEATTRCLGGTTTRCVTSGLAPFTPAVAFTNLGMTGPEGSLEQDNMVQRGTTVSTPTTLTAGGFSVAYTGQQLFARPATKTPSTKTP
jgi:Peptidase A4 family